uniref:hypothetical protein n=1 Tax=Peptostreptococcus faecalis TaxID=2045015 RepID=UPI0015E098B4
FRGNTRVDAGCRFIEDSIPEYMIYDGRKSVSEFIGIIEKGMRASLEDEYSDEEYEKYKKEALKENEEKKLKEKEKIRAKDKYEIFAKENGFEFIKEHYLKNEDFKNKVREVLDADGTKNLTGLKLERTIEIIKYAVEELNIGIA